MHGCVILSFSVTHQRASKTALVPNNISAALATVFGSWGVILEEAKLVRNNILQTQIIRAYGVASMGPPESEAAYQDC